MHRPLAATVALALLAACAQPGADNCDQANRSINFVNLLANSVSGSYDACLDDLRGDLAAARLRARSLEAEAQNLRAEEARLSGERRRAAGRLAALNERQAAAVSRLTEASADREVERAALEQALAQERQTSAALADQNIQGGADPARAAALEAEIARLEGTLSDLNL